MDSLNAQCCANVLGTSDVSQKHFGTASLYMWACWKCERFKQNWVWKWKHWGAENRQLVLWQRTFFSAKGWRIVQVWMVQVWLFWLVGLVQYFYKWELAIWCELVFRQYQEVEMILIQHAIPSRKHLINPQLFGRMTTSWSRCGITWEDSSNWEPKSTHELWKILKNDLKKCLPVPGELLLFEGQCTNLDYLKHWGLLCLHVTYFWKYPYSVVLEVLKSFAQYFVQ